MGTQWRYIDGMKDVDPEVDYSVPGYDYIDLYAGYAVDTGRFAGLTLGAGVENLTDEDPPLLPSSVNANTDASQYDVLGRRYYINASYRF
jgi:outer membrane receptor protein involved in Fe transport